MGDCVESLAEVLMMRLLHDGGKEWGDSLEKMLSGGWLQLVGRP